MRTAAGGRPRGRGGRREVSEGGQGGRRWTESEWVGSLYVGCGVGRVSAGWWKIVVVNATEANGCFGGSTRLAICYSEIRVVSASGGTENGCPFTAGRSFSPFQQVYRRNEVCDEEKGEKVKKTSENGKFGEG